MSQNIVKIENLFKISKNTEVYQKVIKNLSEIYHYLTEADN